MMNTIVKNTFLVLGLVTVLIGAYLDHEIMIRAGSFCTFIGCVMGIIENNKNNLTKNKT